MKLMKMRNLILGLVVSILVIALVQYVGERVQVTKEVEASSIWEPNDTSGKVDIGTNSPTTFVNLQFVMTGCVKEAKAAWLRGMSYRHARDSSTAVAILAAEIFKERIGAN